MNNDEIIFYKSLVKLYVNNTLEIKDLYKYWNKSSKLDENNNPNNCFECPFKSYMLCKLSDEVEEASDYEVPQQCPFKVFMRNESSKIYREIIQVEEVINIDKDCSNCVKYNYILNNFDVRCTKCNPIIMTKLTKEDLEWEEMNFGD